MDSPKNCWECVKSNSCTAFHYGDWKCTEVKTSDYYRTKEAREKIKRSQEANRE